MTTFYDYFYFRLHESKFFAMKEKSISVSEFKAKCLDIIREVQEESVSYTITKHRKVVAQVNPASPPDPGYNPLKNSILYEGDIISPLEEEWEADSGDFEPI